jgi:Tfp pilus assembly protein PilF
MERLAALSEPTLLDRLRLALVRVHGGDETAAEAVLAEVEREQPDDSDAWRVVSEIRRLRAEADQALAAIETAIRLAPLNGELYAYHGDLLLALERPHDAIAALRAALVIDGRQRTWWQQLVQAHQVAGDAAGAHAALVEALAQLPEAPDLQAELEVLGRQTRAARSAPRRSGPGRARPRRSTAGTAESRRQQQTIQRLLRELDDARRLGVRQHNEIARLDIQVSQVRAALGVAERRLYETEVTKQRQLEESWEQIHKLEAAMQEAWAQGHHLDAAMQEAWAQAHRLDAAMQEAGAQARRLDAAMQEAWARAQALDTRARQLVAVLREIAGPAAVPKAPWET